MNPKKLICEKCGTLLGHMYLLNGAKVTITEKLCSKCKEKDDSC